MVCEMVTIFSGIEPAQLVSKVLSVALAAGRSILGVYSQSTFDIQNKEDNSPVTQADLEADQVIYEGLTDLLQGVPVWSEERPKPDASRIKSFWLVDPLDGTKEFIKKNGEFTVNIALIENSEPVLGVIHAPALGESFVGALGLGSFKVRDNDPFDQKLSCVDPLIADSPLQVVGSRSHQATQQMAWLNRLDIPYVLDGVGSSLKFCRIAQGTKHLYLRHGATSQWDTAAGQVILECAGGTVLDSLGNRLSYGLDKNMINDEFIAAGPVAKAFRL